MHRALKHILTGRIVPCGSGCYQTADGSIFLGALPQSAQRDLIELLAETKRGAKLPRQTRVKLAAIAMYASQAVNS